jgi:plasmid stabilization system protein ParE
MGDGHDYQKRQQQKSTVEQAKEALHGSFPTLSETPLLIYPRAGHEGDVEFCVVADGKHYSRSLTPRHARQIARQLLQYADEAEK